MIQVCNFNPDRDVEASVEGLSVDLSAAIESGVVLDTGTLGEFNDIDDPSSILCRVRDTFEALDMQRSILKSAKAKSVSTPVAPSAPSVNLNGEKGV